MRGSLTLCEGLAPPRGTPAGVPARRAAVTGPVSAAGSFELFEHPQHAIGGAARLVSKLGRRQPVAIIQELGERDFGNALRGRRAVGSAPRTAPGVAPSWV